VVLRTGKVLLLTGYNGAPTGYLYDPATGTGTLVPPPDNVFCGGQTLLADGTVIFAGGLLAPEPAAAAGIPAVDTFDPMTETWTKQQSMANGRWYPTTTRMPDGSVLIDSGRSPVASVMNREVEEYQPGNPPTVSLFGPNEALATYPHQFVLPNGQLLATDSHNTVQLNPSTQTWANLASHITTDGRPAGVLLPSGPNGSTKIMLFGGEAAGGAGLANTEVFDASNPGAGWVSAAPMPQPRNDMNTVLLPDGTILGVGGNSSGDFGGPQLQALLYSPATDSWAPLASQVYRRGYHSTAVLLPDGRVLSAGDTGPGGGGNTLEIYSPPYLFQGARPSILNAPQSVGWGQTFNITTSGPVARAVLMAPGATTHNDDMNQRHIELAISQNADGVTATAPATNVAPPGYYMLFVLNSNNIPSVATWVQVGQPASQTVPGAPTGVTADAGDQQATVSWTPPASDGGTAISSYTITASPGGSTLKVDGSTTSAQMTQLTDGTSYTFTVTATNNVGSGQSSAPSNPVTPDPTVAGAPTGVTAQAGNGQATVAWAAPLSTGGHPILSYTVTASPGGNSVTTSDGTTTADTVDGLTNGVSYTFTVLATNSAGPGPPSLPSNAVTPSTAPDPPTGVTAVAGYTEASVAWTPPGNDGGSTIASYTVTASPPDVPPITTPDGQTTSVVVGGLSDGTSYTFTVTATNGSGTSSSSLASNSVTPAPGPPDPPTSVAATAGSGQASVSWVAPANNGGSSITSYTVKASPGGASAVTPDGVTTSIVVPGLTNGTSYRFTVTATSNLGTSAPSQPSNPVTPNSSSTVPGAPIKVKAAAEAGHKAKVTWTAPATDGGSPIISYTVTSSMGGYTVTVTGTTLTATLTGVAPHKTYTFTVTATNANGPGPPSAPSNPITPR
jgi:hypothetical protein